MDRQAQELNEVIERESKAVYSLLSEKGKNIFFPKLGILSQSAEAKGKKINATIGEAMEDDGTPMRLPSLEAQLNVTPSLAFPYAPSPGKPDIRAKWKEMMPVKNPGLKNKPFSLPIVSSALTHGLNMTGYLFVNPGDAIYIPDLYWENYDLIFTNAYGANIKHFRLFDGGKMDMQALKDILLSQTKGKKILLLNFPNNPAGYTPTEKEAEEITALIKESAEKGNQLLIIIDDAYFGLVYEKGVIKESLFSSLADIHENVLAVKLDGPTKEDYVWGFRVGFITYGVKNGSAGLYNALEMKTAGAIRGNISNSNHLGQSMLLKAYSTAGYEDEKKEKYELLKSRYEAVKKELSNPKYAEVLEPIPYNSGYFMCVKLKNGADSEKVRKILLDEYDTGVISMAGVIRVAYSCVSVEKIPQIFHNLYEACKKAK